MTETELEKKITDHVITTTENWGADLAVSGIMQSIREYVKSQASSRPSLDIAEQLREANPFVNRNTDIVEGHESYGYYTAVHKLQELLNQKEG